MMPIATENDFTHKAGRSGALISASAEIWRRLAFYLVVCASFAIVFFTTPANAQISSISGELNTINGGWVNIDKPLTVITWCQQSAGGLGTRTQMGWQLFNSKGNAVTSDWTGHVTDYGLNGPLDFAAYTVPGETYRLRSYCEADYGVYFNNDSAERTFTVNQLSGTANVSAEATTVTVSGAVGNGANRVVVEMDGKAIAQQNDLTSGYSFDFTAPAGTRKFDVYAHHTVTRTISGKEQTFDHSQLIGSSTLKVSNPLVVQIDKYPQFTWNESVMVEGKASSDYKIAGASYEMKAAQGGASGATGSLVHPSATEVSLRQQVQLRDDGRFWVRFRAVDEDDQTGYSDWVTIIRDRQAPKLNNRTQIWGGVIAASTVLRVNVTDFVAWGGKTVGAKDGSGINQVMMQVTDKDNKEYGWVDMALQKDGAMTEGDRIFDADYTFALEDLFAKLPMGDVKISVWAKDNAGNSQYLEDINLKKTNQPTASVSFPKEATNQQFVKLDVTASAEVDIVRIRMERWYISKRNGLRKLREVHLGGFNRGKTVSLQASTDHSYAEAEYFYRVIAETTDGQQSDKDAPPLRIIFDETRPTINLLTLSEGSKLKSKQRVRFEIEDDFSGVDDVQTQICQEGSACSDWYKDIENEKDGLYSQRLPLADLSPGQFTLKVWASDKAGNTRTNEYKFVKEQGADDVLTFALAFKASNGGEATAPFYFDTQRLLQLTVTAKAKAEGIAIANSLPKGLSLAGKATLNGASKGVPATAGAQLSAWIGSGNLLKDIDLEKGATLVIDIPVKISEEPPTRLKVTKSEQTTSFEVTGKNFDGAAKAEATWKADWKKEPADVNAPITKEFDLSEPEEIILFDKVSGGYDTADLAKWNRNTLHCTSGNAECKRNFNSSDIKLRFTEQTTQKTVDLNLSGHRDQTLNPSNRPTRSGALDMQANPGAEAGVDAEVRFSVALPKSELARLPSGGQWSAKLVMEMQDHAGQRLAGFNSDIALTVTDKTGMSLKPPLMELLEGSHNDINQSGGFSSNDEFVYRVTYKASRDLQGVQLQLSLPPELTLTGGQLRDGGSSAFVMPGDGRSRFLLREEMTLKRDETVIIDVPLRVGAGNTARLVSKVEALARGFDPLPSEDAVLNVQRRFDVSEGLGLTFEMIGQPDADATAEAVVVQQTPFKYRVVLASRKHTLEGLKLTYRLPGGMQMDGAPVFVGDIPQLAKVELNPQWDGDANVELLAADAKLPREESITIDIPLKVKEVVGDGVFVKSTVSAGAGNLTGELQKSHRVKTRERETGGGNRVKIVKSMDADAVVQPGAQIRYQIRVSNQTFKTVRNLLIRDRAPDHTTLVDASCGDLKKSECKTLTLSDEVVADGAMTYAGLCKDGGPQSDPQGSHVFWCLKGDLEPMADYTVNYSVRINGAAPAASGPITPSPSP